MAAATAISASQYRHHLGRNAVAKAQMNHGICLSVPFYACD